MPRFVVLRHDSPRGLHWDFMLECGAVLKTWALLQSPEANPEQSAEALADHRPHYLDYEGPLSDNRGMVARWDHGSYELLEQTPVRWIVVLQGALLCGRATLEQLESKTGRWKYRFAGEST